jgi:hypothetical protein
MMGVAGLAVLGMTATLPVMSAYNAPWISTVVE